MRTRGLIMKEKCIYACRPGQGRRHLLLTAYNNQKSAALSHFNHRRSVYSDRGSRNQITYCIILLMCLVLPYTPQSVQEPQCQYKLTHLAESTPSQLTKILPQIPITLSIDMYWNCPKYCQSYTFYIQPYLLWKYQHLYKNIYHI